MVPSGLTPNQPEEEDRLSMLMDDILLSILGRIDLRTAAKTSALSTRWRCLPWLLPELSIDCKNFLSIPHPKPIEEKDLDEAMTSLTKATRSFLVNRHGESNISSLQLKIYLIKNFLFEIGQLVGDAVDSGLLKELNLAILDIWERNPSEEYMQQRAPQIEGFFGAYPTVLHCLTRLSLYNVCIDKLDVHHLLFDCCKQLKHLSLFRCDTGAGSLFKIDASTSELRVLQIISCGFERLELVCLPKLEKFIWDNWMTYSVPWAAFGFVPFLRELELSRDAVCGQREFKLSEVLRGTTCIHTISLDFKGENIWIQPEMKQLLPEFSKLRELSVSGIFVEFELLWSAMFLVAAPCIEILHIEVWEYTCDAEDKFRQRYAERRTPRWKMHIDGSNNWLLKELEFAGFRSLQHQFTFIRATLERAPNLRLVVLKGDEQCDDCDALDTPRCPSKFPKKDEQEMVVRRIQD